MKITDFLLFAACMVFFAGFMSCQPKTENVSEDKPTTTEANVEKEAKNPVNDELISSFIKLGVNVEEGIPEGLATGAQAPLFKAKDSKGELIDLENMLQDGPVVLQFYRGEWCPVCSRYLNAFQDSLSLIEAKGAKVIAVAPETSENVEKAIESFPITYPVIADTELQIMNAYKVTFKVTDAYVDRIKNSRLKTDIAAHNGADAAYLPVPATYVINQDKSIGFVQFDIDYRNRASVESILNHL
ncbi:MAG: peroxiredoxin-like family protein [Bacteroidota bacterium]